MCHAHENAHRIMRTIFFQIMQCPIQKLINFLYRNNIGSESDKNDDNYDESDSVNE